MENDLFESVKDHLRNQYEGIFSDAQMERHFRDYVELDLSQGQLSEVQEIAQLSNGKRVLDLGCGFGSFVLVCRRAGIEAFGMDVAQFELDFARKRLAQEMPGLDPESVYFYRDACSTQLEGQTWDVVTAWNLLEHVENYGSVLKETHRLLKPGGLVLGVAPNYFAFRKEAHYLVPWIPLMPRRLAGRYLEWLGRRGDFFEQQIYYVTSWGILRTLRRLGFNLVYPAFLKVENLNLIKSSARRRIVKSIRQWHMDSCLKIFLLAAYWNPLKRGVYFVGRKPI